MLSLVIGLSFFLYIIEDRLSLFFSCKINLQFCFPYKLHLRFAGSIALALTMS
jgi:hypothetical protein